MRRNRKDSYSDLTGGIATPVDPRRRDIEITRMLKQSAVMCGLLVSVMSQPAPAADLISIYREAQTADAVYAGARASYLAGQEKLPQGRSGLLPAVTLSANTQYNDRDLQFRGAVPASTARYNSNSLNVTATQPLFRLQNWITYEQAKNQVSQTEAAFLQAAQDLIVRVAQAYFDVLLARNNVALAAAQKTAFSEQLAQAKRNFEVGTATITDANDAQARHDLAASQEIAAGNELEIRKQALRQITGRIPPELAKLSSRFTPALPNPNNMDNWVEQAGASSLQVKVAHATLDIAMQDVSKNRSGHLPTLDAVASYTDSSAGSGLQGGAGIDSTTKYIGLQLAVPIYQGGLTTSKVREALANQEKAKQDLE
ncbi:MAG: TolC family outer membrane protein, partial [Pseudomonadota bacterium]